MQHFKRLLLTFAIYLLVSVSLSIALTAWWQTGIDTSGLSMTEITHFAERSTTIHVGSAIIGAISAVFCAGFAYIKSQSNGYFSALVFAVALVVYGILSIFLHPEHTLIQQVSKVIMPIPLCLFGAWIASLITTPKPLANNDAVL